MCEKHYHAEYRREAGFWITCEQCGAEVMKPHKSARFCSKSCSMRARPRTLGPTSQLGRAVMAGDAQAVFDAALARATVDANGCWIWHSTQKAGYAIFSWNGSSKFVHRVVLEAKLGRKLGREQAHHVCSASLCVNPAHLAPATQRANIAEMQARTSMLARIAQLEQALRTIAPGHPVLGIA